MGSCQLILFFPSIHGKTAPDTVYCPLSQKFVSFRKIHFCKYRLISDPPAGFCRKFCIDPCIGSTHIPVKIGCIKGTTDHDLWQFLFFPVISSHAGADRKKKHNIPHKNSLFFFIYIPQIILLVYYIKAVSDCLYAISTTHFPGQQYLFSRIRDDKSDFPEFSLHHFLKPLRFHSIRNRGIGIIKMCQQHCLWFKPL